MASSVSFIMMPPKMRSGRAWKKVGWNRPSSMPMKPKTMPLAASLAAVQGSEEYRPGKIQHDGRDRQQEQKGAGQFHPDAAALREAPGYDIDADVLVLQQRIGRTEQEHRREQIPLHFEESIGAHVENLAYHRIDRTDQYGSQHKPDRGTADQGVHPVDQAG
jgi:hypothetical protein